MDVLVGIGLVILGLFCGMTVAFFIAGASRYNREYEIYKEGYDKGYLEGKQQANKEEQ